MVTREMLDAKMAEYREMATQIQQNLSAMIGAMQDIEYWLEQIDEQEADVPDKESEEEPDTPEGE